MNSREREDQWVTISAEALCAFVAFGDKRFAKHDSDNQLRRVQEEGSGYRGAPAKKAQRKKK